jgi:hypothetical protein
MEQSTSIKELATALAKVQGELKPAPKDSENPFFKSAYADLATVTKTVMPVLAKHGLSVTQVAEGEGNITTQLMHTSGEWLRGTLSLKPVKDDPQGRGSAITYARRYALASICGLATEDDDGNAATHEKPKGKPPGDDPLAHAVRYGLGGEEVVPKLTDEQRHFVDGAFDSIQSAANIEDLKKAWTFITQNYKQVPEYYREKLKGQKDAKKLNLTKEAA